MPDDGVHQFVRVSPGEFTMGADHGEEDERPAHRVFLESYYISIHAVTNENSASFVRDTEHRVPAVRERQFPSRPGAEKASRHSAGGLLSAERPDTYTYSIGFRVVYSDLLGV